jgi:hypothetical protein
MVATLIFFAPLWAFGLLVVLPFYWAITTYIELRAPRNIACRFGLKAASFLGLAVAAYLAQKYLVLPYVRSLH